VRIYSKILLITLPLIVAGLLVVTGLTYYLAQGALTTLAEDWLKEKLSDATAIARENQTVLTKYGLEHIAANVKKARLHAAKKMSAIQIGTHGYVCAIDSQGTVVFHPKKSLKGRTLTKVAWFEKIRGHSKGQVHYHWLDEDLLAVYEYFQPWGWYILANAPQGEIYGQVNRMRAYVLALGLFGIVATALVLTVLVHRLTAPLHTLVNEAERIGTGDFETPVSCTSHDEIGVLADAIDTMRTKLRSSYTKLEQRVIECTLAEESLRKSEEQYRAIFNNAAVGIDVVGKDGYFSQVNWAFANMLGYTQEELKRTTPIDITHPDDRDLSATNLHALLQGDVDKFRMVKRFIMKNGSVRWVDLSVSPISGPGGAVDTTVGVIVDITDRKSLEDQLRQAAKMEAIGQLAGGVAHDFNNLLTAILGYSGIVLQRLSEDDVSREKIVQIARAAERAAELTKQLLAFSRKQMLEVRPMNLNDTISDLEVMLKRLIGEDIELVTSLDPSIGSTQADPGQVEQIIINLCVNARDAMVRGGKLSIETSNVTLGEEYCRAHAEVDPGEYVLFSVSDNGVGMDSQTRTRIFDPFFTTKEKGVGTGLGLSTVYGIVKQHQGHIAVYSEAMRGTTFKVYLPRVDTPVKSKAKASPVQLERHGVETLLVVEDDQFVRDLACELLEMLGYSLLNAQDPKEAIQVAAAYEGTIHLLLTDVILPQMDGRTLFNRLSPLRPEMKVLYVSGYTENFIVDHGVLEAGVHFLQKPFTLNSLAHKVREVLDCS
jgi:PAS domain S-box-containing protein